MGGKALESTWAKRPCGRHSHLVESMPRHIEAILRAKGGAQLNIRKVYVYMTEKVIMVGWGEAKKKDILPKPTIQCYYSIYFIFISTHIHCVCGRKYSTTTETLACVVQKSLHVR